MTYPPSPHGGYPGPPPPAPYGQPQQFGPGHGYPGAQPPKKSRTPMLILSLLFVLLLVVGGTAGWMYYTKSDFGLGLFNHGQRSNTSAAHTSAPGANGSSGVPNSSPPATPASGSLADKPKAVLLAALPQLSDFPGWALTPESASNVGLQQVTPPKCDFVYSGDPNFHGVGTVGYGSLEDQFASEIAVAVFKWGSAGSELSNIDDYVSRCAQNTLTEPSPEGTDTFTFHLTITKIDPPPSSAPNAVGYSRSGFGSRLSDGAQVPYQPRVLYIADIRGVGLLFQCKNVITFQTKCYDLYRRTVDNLQTLQ